MEGEAPAEPVKHERWWGLSIDQGERGLQTLKPADTYTFVIGKRIGVIDYEAFCR
ncbi:hypothetical protein D3C78_1582840 [compost metagenome]